MKVDTVSLLIAAWVEVFVLAVPIAALATVLVVVVAAIVARRSS